MSNSEKTPDVKLNGYRQRDPDSNAKYIARVSFAFVPDDLQPLQIKRSYNAAKSEKDPADWKNIDVAEIHQAKTVIVKEAYIRQSKKGNYYLDVSGLDVPFDVAARVLELAAERNIAEPTTKAGAA